MMYSPTPKSADVHQGPKLVRRGIRLPTVKILSRGLAWSSACAEHQVEALFPLTVSTQCGALPPSDQNGFDTTLLT